MEDTNTPTVRQGVNQSDSSTVRNRNLPTQRQGGSEALTSNSESVALTSNPGSVTLTSVATSANGQHVDKDGVQGRLTSASSPQSRVHHLHKLEK